MGCVASYEESGLVRIGGNDLMEGRAVQRGASHVARSFHLATAERE